jgi:glucokinase
MDDPVILAGDVGGTKTYLALFQPRSQGYTPVCEARYTTADYPSLGALLADFVAAAGRQPARVAVGVPGPVRQLPVRAVNLPWLIDPNEISAALHQARVTLLNDLEATSYGTQVLQEADLAELNPAPVDAEGNVAVIAAGTGLGEGGLCWTGNRYTAVASEGGHSSFSPVDDESAELWRYLVQRHGHVSFERVLSGPGLVSIYEFLRDTGRVPEPAAAAAELALVSDRAGAISTAAAAGANPLATATLDLFVYLYGVEAGNLALKLMCTGGLYVGGGIAPKIVDHLRRGRFMEGFLHKGRMGEPLRAIPVKVILNDKAGLLGAAYRAAQLEGAI